ncbi:MAG TPA: alpha/beta hydrolase [Anaerolineae bacterium]|nr:alpha/beta hydrolase [Anaerolineae bacterium]
MTHTSAFKTPEGEAAYLGAYDAAMKLWPVSYEEIEIPTRFGMTHVVTSGPKDAPPLVLLHGYMANLTMWSPNVADFSRDYRVYAIDTMGQAGRSIPDPDESIRDAADLIAWLSETLNGLNLDRIFLVGMSFGGWLALNFAMTAPERVRKLVLLSPAASFQPLVRQFGLCVMPMIFFPTRLTVNSLMGWMGIKDTAGDAVTQCVLELAYLGAKHFRFVPETARVMPSVFSDNELRALHVPVLLLIGQNEVIYDAAKALDRARRLLPNCEGELVPQSSHEMCSSQCRIVDVRALDFLSHH